MVKVWYGKLWLHLFCDEVSTESGRCRAGTEDQNRQRASEMEATPGYTAPTTSKKIFRWQLNVWSSHHITQFTKSRRYNISEKLSNKERTATAWLIIIIHPKFDISKCSRQNFPVHTTWSISSPSFQTNQLAKYAVTIYCKYQTRKKQEEEKKEDDLSKMTQWWAASSPALQLRLDEAASLVEGDGLAELGDVEPDAALHVGQELGLHQLAQHERPRPEPHRQLQRHRRRRRALHRRAAQPRPAAVQRHLVADHRHRHVPRALPRLVEVLHLSENVSVLSVTRCFLPRKFQTFRSVLDGWTTMTIFFSLSFLNWN